MSNRTPQLLGTESLEGQRMMAKDAVASPDISAAESAKDAIIISAIHLEVGDQEFIVTKRNDVIRFKPGQHLQVVGIDFEVTSTDGSSTGFKSDAGVIAFEGYLQHASKKSTDAEEFRYDDGRFTAVELLVTVQPRR